MAGEATRLSLLNAKLLNEYIAFLDKPSTAAQLQVSDTLMFKFQAQPMRTYAYLSFDEAFKYYGRNWNAEGVQKTIGGPTI